MTCSRSYSPSGHRRLKLRRAYNAKGHFHWNKDERSESVRAFETVASFCDEGSEKWWDSKGLAAWGWLLHKDHERAIAAHEALLSRADLGADFKMSVLIRLVESRLALGDRARAEELRRQFKATIDAYPARLMTQEDRQDLLKRCDALFAKASKE